MKIKQMTERLTSVPVRKKAKQILAVTLSVLMVNPVTGYGVSAHAQEVETITAFAKLSSQITSQQLAVGAEESDINLPDTLNVTLSVNSTDTTESIVKDSQPEEIPTEEVKPDESNSEEPATDESPSDDSSVSGNDAEGPQEDANGAEDNTATDSQATVVLDSGEVPLAATTTGSAISTDLDDADAEQTEPEEFISEERTLTGITWQINAERSGSDTFNSESAGAEFYYEPVLPEGYTLADGVSLPEIQVKIEENVRWAFSQSTTIDGIEITVKAEKNVFPEGAVLHAEKVTSADDKEKIQNAVSEEVQSEDAAKTVTELVSFDITITDAGGNELQPDTSKGEVRVSFSQLPMVTEVAAPTQELKVFHMDDSLSNAKGLDTTVDQEAGTLEAPAEHFTVYTAALLTATAEDGEASITAADGAVTYYDTIEEAITAAIGMSGSTVKLLKDVATENRIEITTGNFSIDLNGKTWTGPEIWEVDGNTNCAIEVIGTPTLILKDTVGGGVFTSANPYKYVILIIPYNADISLEGGTYSGIRSSKNIDLLLAENYAFQKDGSWVTDLSVKQITDVTVAEAPSEMMSASVIEAGGTVHRYLIIEKAIIAAQGMSGSTVKLLKDVETENLVTISSGTFILDLNGKTWHNSASSMVTAVVVSGSEGNAVSLIIKDSTGGGHITTVKELSISVSHYASVRLEGGTYTGVKTLMGTAADLLADGYAYKSSESGEWVTDMSGDKISNVTVAEAPSEMMSASVTEAGGTVHRYLTIEKAIIAAQGMSGCTVKLLKDVETKNYVSISSGTFILDLNGKTWHNSASTMAMAVVVGGSEGNEVSLIIKDSVGGGCITTVKTLSISVSICASVRIEGGTYTGVKTLMGTAADLLADGYAYKNSDNTWVTDMNSNLISNVTVSPIPVKITAQPEDAIATPGYTEAPTFTVTAQTVPADSGKAISYKWYSMGTGTDGANELIADETNASFTVPTGLSEGTYTYYCDVTCDSYTVKTPNASFYVSSSTGNYAVTASNGITNNYPTLEIAITAAKTKPNSTVKLLADATTAEKVEVNSGTFTIDLNGKTWTSTASDVGLKLSIGSHVTLMDSADGGKITTSTASYTIHAQRADLTIESGIYENESNNDMSRVLGAYHAGTVTIQGGTIQTSKSIMHLAYFQSVDVVISGGTFSGNVTAFDNCDSVALSGGEYKSISTITGTVASLLASGYGFKNKSDSNWVNRLTNPTDNANDLAHTFLQSPVRVERLPLEIINQPTAPESVVYGYSEAAQISMYAERTAHAPTGSTVTYRLWKVKSGEESYDSAVGEAAYNNRFTLPAGLDAGSYQYYIVAECDGCQLRSKTVTLTVEKAVPTITLDVIVYEDEPFTYGNLMYFTATVTGTNGDYPDGTVTFMDGNDVLFADVAYSTKSHHYQKASDDVPAGTHSFTAIYTPSTDGTGKNYVSATSTAVEQTIAKADQSISITEVDGKKYKDADFTLEITGGKGTGAVTFSVPEGNGVLSISQKEDGRFDAAIIGAGEVTVTATKAADNNFNSATATLEITIVKADTTIEINPMYTDSYTYTGNALAVLGESDLAITGASYSDVTVTWYKDSVADGNQLSAAPSAPGTYVIVASIADTANFSAASAEKTVTISYYSVDITVSYNGAEKLAGTYYNADVTITATGFTISDSINGTYTASYILAGEGVVNKTLYFKQNGTGYITAGQDVTVNIDKTAPAFTGETDGITISDNNWKGFLNQITFGHFFKENKDVSISATDSGPGVVKYYYYIDTGSTTAKTAEELKNISFTEGSSFSITEENKYIIYAYAVDQAGNRSAYICTDGIVIDKTAPTVTLTAPTGSDLGDVSATVKAQMNETGTITYVIKTTEQSGMTSQNILDATDKKTVSVIDGQADTNLDVVFSGLTANNTYYMYAVGTDSAQNNGSVVSTSFITTKSQPVFNENPTITGTYGQQVKDMTVSQVASTNGVAGSWSVSSTDKPSVGTAATYDVVFIPNDAVQYATVTVPVTPTVNPKSLTAAGVTIGEVTGTYTYDKTEKVPTVTVTDSAATITASDYEYSYSNNVSAGTATVTVTAKGNYTGTVSHTFTIAKATAPSITWPNASSITYGQKLSASALSVSSTEYGTFAWTDGSTVLTVENGGYEVTFTPNAGTVANYKAITNTTEMVVVTVSKVTPAVTVSTDISDDAGSRKATLTATVTGAGDGETPTGTVKFVNSTSGSDVDIAGATAVTITGGKVTYTWTGLAKQIYKVKAVYNGSANYNNATSTELEVDTNKQNQAALNIGSIGTKTYGDGAFTLSATGGSMSGAASFTSSDPTIVSISGTTATIHRAGTVTITATKAANNTYNEVTASVSLTVGKKALAVKANDQLNIIKGSALPEFTYTVTGLVDSDTFTNPSISTTAADTNTVGEYDITISGGTLANADSYAVTYTNGKLMVVNATYTVTVTNGTGGGSFSEGQIVTITADSRNGYTFTGWSSSDGVTFANSTASTTTFTMPGKAVTVTANYSKNSSGDSGGSSSGGSSSGGSSISTTTTTPEKKPNQPITAVAPVTATAGSNGAASASIPDKAVTDAIVKAQSDATSQGKTANGISVELDVTMPKGTASFTATLTRNSLDSLVSAGVSSLEINGSLVQVSFDKKALTEIQKQSSGNISIAIAPKTNLSDVAKKLIGTRPVYDITVGYGSGKSVSSFGGGVATVSIPYTLGKNEAVGGLYAVYVDAKGNANRIAGSAYDTNSGCVIFATTHFSQYGIGYTAPTAKFTDISTHWAKESVDYVVGRGLLSGTSDTAFSPNSAMTRGMLVTALGRLAGVDTKAYTTSSFTDVNADSAYRSYIEWAYSKGIIQGIGGGQFAPDRAITREEIVVIFTNYAKATGYTLPITREATTYADASSIGSAYKDAVKSMQQAGIMMGGSDNKFNPKGNATRAEVSSMLNRYIKLTINPDTAQGWTLNDAGQYLYYKDGKALTGTQTIDGVKYFVGTDGTLKTGWVKDGDNWRFYSGKTMLVGFWDLGANGNNKTYYFAKDGLMVSGKWLEIDGKWYYFYTDGSLAISTKIDGYEVDEKGVRKAK